MPGEYAESTSIHEQLEHRHAKRNGNSLDVVERDVAGLTLDVGNERAVQAAPSAVRRRSKGQSGVTSNNAGIRRKSDSGACPPAPTR